MRTGGSGARGEQAFCTLHGLSYFIVFIYILYGLRDSSTGQHPAAHTAVSSCATAFSLFIDHFFVHTHTHTVHTVHTRGFSTRQHSRSQHVRCQS